MGQESASVNRNEGEKYLDIHEVVTDCAEGRPVYLRGFLTASEVILKSRVNQVLDMIARGQIRRCRAIF